MAITLRNVKGTELSHAEMDTNLESYYYSSSLSGNTLTLHTTGSDTHSIDLSGLATADTNIGNTSLTLNGNRTLNLGTNNLTIDAVQGETFSITADNSATVLFRMDSGDFKITDLPNTETPVVLGYDSTTGVLSYYSTSSFDNTNTNIANTNLTLDENRLVSFGGNNLVFNAYQGEEFKISSSNASSVVISDLTNSEVPHVVGYNSTTGQLSYYSTGSLGSGGGGSVDTGSFYVSSSINSGGNVITFNQGDGTTESVTVDTANYASAYDITNKSTTGPGVTRTSYVIAGGSVIASGGTTKTIRIPEIADKDLGNDVFITATYVGGDTDVPITVQASGAAADIPRTINSNGEIDFKAGGSTLASNTYFMYHIIYTE